MASSANSNSPSRLRPRRKCCCSRSRWQAAASPNQRARANCCRTCGGKSPSCWSSMTWTRCSRWPTASVSWSTGASSLPTPRRRSATMKKSSAPISASSRRGPAMSDQELADAAPLLEVEEIETCYGLSQALFGLSLSVRSGEMVAMMGRNGMGKTTTIRSIMGLTPARSGAIRFAGHDVRKLPSFRIAQLGIGLVPEGRQIFPNLTVRENLVAASGNRLGSADPWTIEKIHALFPRLAERGNNMGGTLSGGEQQMLAVGRALMTNPRLLILDEATEGLAPLIREEIWNCLSLLKAQGQSVLVIDKNIENLTRIADRHYIIERGCAVWSGTSEQLIAEPGLQHRYLGV